MIASEIWSMNDFSFIISAWYSFLNCLYWTSITFYALQAFCFSYKRNNISKYVQVRHLWTILKWLQFKEHILLQLLPISSVQFSSVAQSCMTLQPHGLQHTILPCPSPTPGAYSNSCPLSRWCHLTVSSSVVPFFSHLQSFPISGSFQMSQFFTSGGQSIGVSASTSVLPMNIQDWFPLGWTSWISL